MLKKNLPFTLVENALFFKVDNFFFFWYFNLLVGFFGVILTDVSRFIFQFLNSYEHLKQSL